MLCPYCKPETTMPINKADIEEHLIIIKNKNGHYHVHGPLLDTKEITTMLTVVCKETKIQVNVEELKKKLPNNKITSTSKEQKRLNTQYSTTQPIKYKNRVA